MRKVWPFIGIALAVSGGIALAPYFWWLLPVACLAAIGWRWRRYWPFAVIAAAYCWPGWFLWHAQFGDAATAFVLVTLLFFWQHLRGAVRPYWLKVFPD